MEDAGHTKMLHLEKLNSMCRICGGRSKKRYDIKAAYVCHNYKELIQQCYKINVDDDNKLVYSKTLCRCCYSRMKRLQNSTPTTSTIAAIESDIQSSECIWTEFDPSDSVEECTVCFHFQQQGKGKNVKQRCSDLTKDGKNTSNPEPKF